MKKLLLTITVLVSVQLAYSQERKSEDTVKGFNKEKLFFGGSFGLSFGDYTFINISPQLGYRFNRYLAAGAGVNFQYASTKQRMLNGDPYRKVSQGVVGLNAFGRVYPIQYLMVQAQPELNYVFGNQRLYQTRQVTKIDAEIIPSLLAGGGVVLPSGRSAFIIGIFYDVLQKENAPYGDKPFITFNYNIGF